MRQQPFNMAVHHFGGVTYRVARNGVLAFLENGFVINGAGNYFKAQLRKKGMPKRQQFVHIKAERQADFAAPAWYGLKFFQ